MSEALPKPLWPLPEGYWRPEITVRRGMYQVWTDDVYIGGFDQLERAMDAACMEARRLSEGTEYTERREKLAEFLCDLVYGDGAWAEVDEDTLLNYRLDADDIIKANPHLLSLEERERLQYLIPELKYGEEA